jgi:hypothetical protein
MNTPNNTQLKKNRSSLYISLAIILISLILNLTLYKTFILDADERHMVRRATAILCGDLPWVDFTPFTYAPGIYLLLAFVFWIFSPSLIVERFLWVIFRCLIALFTYRAAQWLMPRSFALFPTIMVMLLPAVFYKSFYSMFILINLLLLLSYVSGFQKKWLILSGLGVGFTMWFREDIAGCAAITCGLCILLNNLPILKSKGLSALRRTRLFFKNSFKTAGLYALLVIGAFSPIVIYYAVRGHAYKLLYQLSIGHAKRYLGQRARDSLSFPSFKEIFIPHINWDAVFVWFPLLLFVSLFIVLAYRFSKNRAFSKHDWLLFATLMFSSLVYYHTFLFPTYERLLENGAQIFTLWGYVIYLIFSAATKALRSHHKKSVLNPLMKGIIVVGLLIYPGWFAYYGLSKKAVSDRLTYARHKDEFIQSDTDIWLREKQTRKRINEVIGKIKESTKKTDTFLIIDSGLIYFYGERRKMAVQKVIPKHLREKDLVNVLKTVNPKFVAIDHWASCSLVRLSKPFQVWFSRQYKIETSTGRFTIYMQKNRIETGKK